MFHIHDVVQLKEGERVQRIVRRHLVTLLPSLILGAVFIILPFFFLFYLLHGGAFGIIAFVLSVAFGLFLALRAMHIWDADVLVITTQRLVDVDQHGIWARMVAEVPLDAIQEVRWERAGMKEALFRMGTVRIMTAVPPSELVTPFVLHPEQLQAFLQEIRQATHARPLAAKRDDSAESSLSPRERIQILLVQANEKTLVEVEHLLQERADGTRRA